MVFFNMRQVASLGGSRCRCWIGRPEAGNRVGRNNRQSLRLLGSIEVALNEGIRGGKGLSGPARSWVAGTFAVPA